MDICGPHKHCKKSSCLKKEFGEYLVQQYCSSLAVVSLVPLPKRYARRYVRAVDVLVLLHGLNTTCLLSFVQNDTCKPIYASSFNVRQQIDLVGNTCPWTSSHLWL